MFLCSLHRWLKKGRPSIRHRLRTRPYLEALEDRCLPSTVTNLADSGAGSLRDAIASTPSGGTVDFQPGLSGTIALTSGELAINKDLNIIGPGAGVLTVSGNHASRVFDITGAFTVGIAGLTITDGMAQGFGGGIYNGGGTLTVTASTLSGNSIAGPGAGGGIFSNAGKLTVIDSTLSGNSASGRFARCGGICNGSGTLTVIDSTLSGNTGGGIANIGNGTSTITNSTLSGNSGSGIVNNGRLIVINNSTLSGNSANQGGGIENGGTLIITNSTLSGNSANLGGGIENGSPLTVTTITNSTLSGNSANFEGGGIENGGTLIITNSTLSGNSAGTMGGGIENFYGTLTVTNSTLSGNSARGSGGGIFVGTLYQPVTALRNTILAGNTAPTAPDVGGTLNSQGYNLIGIGDGGSGFADTDLVGTADFPIDPMLQPLGDYGGPTQTMPPLPDSPAINAGDNTNAPDTDQRGFARIVLGFIDIGAVELQPNEFNGPAAVAAPLITPVPAAPPAAMTQQAVPSTEITHYSRLDALFQLLGNSSPRKHAAGLMARPSAE